MDLAVDAAIRPIPYFQPNGIPRRLDRHVQISYPDMEWDAEARLFRPSTKEVEVEASDDERTLVVSASLADAVYTIHGDRFTKELSLPFTAVATDEILTPKVEVYAFVDKVDGGSAIGDNTPEEGDASLVSAPFTVMLAAYGNEPSAANFVWRIYRTEEGLKTVSLSIMELLRSLHSARPAYIAFCYRQLTERGLVLMRFCWKTILRWQSPV